jgi:hypothetical protein
MARSVILGDLDRAELGHVQPGTRDLEPHLALVASLRPSSDWVGTRPFSMPSTAPRPGAGGSHRLRLVPRDPRMLGSRLADAPCVIMAPLI